MASGMDIVSETFNVMTYICGPVLSVKYDRFLYGCQVKNSGAQRLRPRFIAINLLTTFAPRKFGTYFGAS
jgi:hypothetical protein